MSHDARAVANQLLSLARKDDKWFTPLQILKLSYYCQGWSLAIFNSILFYQEIEAWRYGPIVPAIYQEAKIYVDNPITEHIYAQRSIFDEQDLTIVNAVYLKYGKYNGKQLITLTHKSGSPWDQIWSNRITDHDIIPTKIIQGYFIGLQG